MIDNGSQILIHRVVDCRIVAVRFHSHFIILFLLWGNEIRLFQPGVFCRSFFASPFVNRGASARKTSWLGSLGSRNNFVFQFAESRLVAGFKRLDDVTVSANSLGFVGLEGFQLPNGQ